MTGVRYQERRKIMPLIDTSLESWTKTKPKLAKLHTRVYEAIGKYPDHTTDELSLILHIPIQTKSGRARELLKKGLVKRVFRRTCSVTKNQAWTWETI